MNNPKSFNINIDYNNQAQKIEILLKDQNVAITGVGIITIQDVLEEIASSIIKNYCDISENDFNS